MLDLLALFTDLGHRLDADLQVRLGPALGDREVRHVGLDAFRSVGEVGDQEQGAAGDRVVVADDEEGRRLHVDPDAAEMLQPLEKPLVVLPEPPVGGVDHPGPVLQVAGGDLLGDELVELERRQGRDLRRQVVGAGSLAPDRRDRQDEVAELGGVLEAAALAQEEDALRVPGGQEIHHRGGVRRAHAEVDDRQPTGVGRRLHRAADSLHIAGKPLAESFHVVVKVGEQNVLTEVVDGHARVSGQPVLGDVEATFHEALFLGVSEGRASVTR